MAPAFVSILISVSATVTIGCGVLYVLFIAQKVPILPINLKKKGDPNSKMSSKINSAFSARASDFLANKYVHLLVIIAHLLLSTKWRAAFW